jgi:hypothetical protein
MRSQAMYRYYAQFPTPSICFHCKLKIYLDGSGMFPVWRHHGSNFEECFGAAICGCENALATPTQKK